MGLPDMDDGWEADDDRPYLDDEGDPPDWTDEDEDALDQFEEDKRRRIAEANEY